ncbi:MAG: hypothetical protein RIQ50_134 [Bacteroidota bacterium]|jgi:putative transcriptional regulator
MNKVEKGTLLIAEPFMKDENFQRSVVLICQDQHEGSVGFIINRKLKGAVGDWVQELEGCTLPVFEGGPVGKDQMHFLHAVPEIIPGGHCIAEGVYWGGDFDTVKSLAQSNQLPKSAIRFIIGYSGWDEGQLNTEMNEKSWLTAPASHTLVFHEKPQQIWGDAVKTLGNDFLPLLNYPIDPSLN